MQQWDLLSIAAPQGTRDPVVLHSDDGARAVLLVLEPGQGLGDHQVKENAWITVLDGTVQVSGDGDSVEASRGALFHFPPDERHSVTSDGGARVLLLLAPWPGQGHFRGDR